MTEQAEKNLKDALQQIELLEAERAQLRMSVEDLAAERDALSGTLDRARKVLAQIGSIDAGSRDEFVPGVLLALNVLLAEEGAS